VSQPAPLEIAFGEDKSRHEDSEITEVEERASADIEGKREDENNRDRRPRESTARSSSVEK
jgi:hypothetical protein